MFGVWRKEEAVKTSFKLKDIHFNNLKCIEENWQQIAIQCDNILLVALRSLTTIFHYQTITLNYLSYFI